MNENVERARELMPSLVGLTIVEARNRVAGVPGVYLREVTREAGVEQSFGFGRITVTVANGRVAHTELG